MLQVAIRDMRMAASHLTGAINIIKAAGGPEALSLSNLIKCILFSCVYGKRLLDWDPSQPSRDAPLGFGIEDIKSF